MAFIEKIRENGGDIKLSSMSDKVFNIFDLLGFPLLYEIFKTEEEAVKKFNEIKECFIAQSVHTNPILKNKFKFREIPNAKLKIENYFKEFIGSKFGEKYAKNFN